MSRYYNDYPAYVPVAQRRANARRMMKQLEKDGKIIEPVEIEGRKIARSFWGKGWCDHLESFSDFSNRLPRGRTYARNGSVCHLGIKPGTIEAYVAGTDLYEVEISISPLAKKKWAKLKKACTGNIGSLIELLQGRLSDDVMASVTDRKNGLFPQPGEIEFRCTCPDWARMCKHVAAVLYGVGARLDEQPELLFTLRGVDQTELVADSATVDAIVAGGAKSSSRRRKTLDSDDLGGLFGVEMEGVPAPKPRSKTTTKKTTKKKVVRNTTKTRKASVFKPTPANVAKLREKLGMNKSEFARAIGVSPPTITNWETSSRPIHPRPEVLKRLQELRLGG